MTTSVHICPVGFYPEPVTAVLGSGLVSDRFYLLYNQHPKSLQARDDIKAVFVNAGITDIEEREINPFEYGHVLSTLMCIYNEELEKDPDTEFYINFTSGTNIVAGACCSAAYFIGATLYYVMNPEEYPDLKKNERIRVINIPRIPDISKMKTTARDILILICENDGIGLDELASKMQSSSQKMNHHLNNFVDSGLIYKEKVGRHVRLHATEQGLMFVNWIKKEDRAVADV